MSGKPYVIELWDRESEHVYLATGEDQEVLKFGFYDDAYGKAQEICTKAFYEFDREFSFFVTQHPHKLATPLI